MIRIFLFISFHVLATTSFAQKESFDLTTYTSPKAWKKEVKAGSHTSFTITNKQKKTYCQIFVMLSTASKGDIKQDFESQWRTLVVKQYGVTDSARLTEPTTHGSWQALAGIAPFSFNNGVSTALLTTMSGYNKAVSIVTVTNSEDYIPAIQKFLESVEMKTPSTNIVVTKTVNDAVSNKFTFSTTNFDDGWASTVKEDWVEVTKGTNRVLIHYPNKQADVYNSVLMDGLKNAWNILVAPRYSTATNLEFKPIIGWQSIEFAEADMTEKASGKMVHVVLFKMNYSNGSGKYLEFINSSKQSFESEFGPYHQSSFGWEKMENMAFRNKFAVGATDLAGKWTNNFSGAIQYVNASTGFDAGMDTHASAENYQFIPGNLYKWDLAVASGAVGNIKFQSVKSSGKFTMDGNWKVSFSDIEGKPRNYDVYFSCIKGLRILWIDNRAFGRIE
jgi:hypothetical protein